MDTSDRIYELYLILRRRFQKLAELSAAGPILTLKKSVKRKIRYHVVAGRRRFTRDSRVPSSHS